MSRLVAFGCSYTYGHGLTDCHIDPNLPGSEPSKFSWPSLLADMLNVEVVNCSDPGASNIHMLWKLINFEFKKDDICVIMWSHFGRLPFSNLKYDPNNVIWENYDRSVIRSLPDIDKENIIVKNCIVMHHAYSYLEMKNIKHMMVVAPNDLKSYKFPYINIPSLNADITIQKYQSDLALDNLHPGPDTHKTIAKEIYNKINVIH